MYIHRAYYGHLRPKVRVTETYVTSTESNGNTRALDTFFRMSRHYAKTWCATLYDATEEELKELIKPYVEEATFQKELCPTTGREHIQAVFKFSKRRTFADVRRLFSKYRPHLEVCRNYLQATQYCSKDESKIGDTIRLHKAQPRDETIRHLIEQGDLQTIRSEHYGFYLRHRRALLEDMVAQYNPRVCQHTRGIWLTGLPGSGKTKAVTELHEKIYWKGQNKWWDG